MVATTIKTSKSRNSSHNNSNSNEMRQKYKLLNESKPNYMFNPDFEDLHLEDVRASAILDEQTTKPVAESGDSSQTSYIGKLYKTPLLTASGEAALFLKYNYVKYLVDVTLSKINPNRPSARKLQQIECLLDEAEVTRNQIIESNLRLVVSIARKFCSQNATFEELVSEGNTILMNAVEKFDYARGFRFSTYVTHSVQRHFYRYLNKAVKRNTKEVAVSQEILHESATSEISSPEVLDTTKADVLLQKLDLCLDEREQFILRERFGFGPSGVTRTYQSLSEDLGICKERVRQVFNVAVEKLRSLAVELNMEISLS